MGRDGPGAWRRGRLIRRRCLLRALRLIDGSDLVGRRSRLAALDLDPARLHGLRQMPLEVELQQAVLERRTFDLDIVREVEAPLERPARNAAVEIVGLTLLLVRAADEDQRVAVTDDADLLGLEARDRERDAIAVLAGSHDIAGRIVVLGFEAKALVHQIENAIEADARPPERIQIWVPHNHILH